MTSLSATDLAALVSLRLDTPGSVLTRLRLAKRRREAVDDHLAVAVDLALVRRVEPVGAEVPSVPVAVHRILAIDGVLAGSDSLPSA